MDGQTSMRKVSPSGADGAIIRACERFIIVSWKHDRWTPYFRQDWISRWALLTCFTGSVLDVYGLRMDPFADSDPQSIVRKTW